MLGAVGQGLRLWLTNLPLLSALVLTIWLPANAGLAYMTATAEEDISMDTEFRFPLYIEGILGPIYIGAVIYALDKRRQGKRVGYLEALGVGFNNWGRMFGTRFVAGLIIFFGCLCFVIPGIVLAVRYALLDMAVIVEGKSGEQARARSWDLVKGNGLQIGVIYTIIFVGFVFVSGALYVPLEFAFEFMEMTVFQYYAADVVISCVSDILLLPLTAVLYCVYLHVSGRGKMIDEQQVGESAVEAAGPANAELIDDGNPYRPPQHM